MKQDLRTYELRISDSDALSGVFAVSLVEAPAIETEWVLLSEETRLSMDDKRYALTGAFIIPNRKIYRNDPNLGEHYVYISPETIVRLSEKFAKGGFHSKTTHEHSISLFGNTVMESWIIQDPKNDKANALGFNLPEGTWMITVKVNDKRYWDEFVASGKVRGFSLEGVFEKTLAETDTVLAERQTQELLRQLQTDLAALKAELSALKSAAVKPLVSKNEALFATNQQTNQYPQANSEPNLLAYFAEKKRAN